MNVRHASTKYYYINEVEYAHATETCQGCISQVPVHRRMSTHTHWRNGYFPGKPWSASWLHHLLPVLILNVCIFFREDGGGGHCLVQMEWHPAGWSVYLPLLIFPCTIKSRGSLLAPAHPGGPGKRAIKRLWWCASSSDSPKHFISCLTPSRHVFLRCLLYLAPPQYHLHD